MSQLRLGNPSEWAFLAEGGAHIVFRYIGQDPILTRKVLKINKKSTKASVDPNELVVRLQLHEHADMIESVAVEPLWLGELLYNSHEERENHRIMVHPRIQASKVIYLQENYHSPPTSSPVMMQSMTFMSIEIKPKWHGAEAFCQSMDLQDHLINCRFCQEHNSQVEMGQRYCPGDLLCGQPDRVAFALKGLRLNPRNNIFVYINGSKCPPSSIPDILIREISQTNVVLELLSWLGGKILDSWMSCMLCDDESKLKVLLQEAVCMRDCSFIVSFWCRPDGSIYSMARPPRLIDLDHSIKTKIEKYLQELEDLRQKLSGSIGPIRDWPRHI